MPSISRLTPTRYIGAALLCVVAFVALYLFFVRDVAGQAIDQLAFNGAEDGSTGTTVTRQLLDLIPSVMVAIGAIVSLIIATVRRAWFPLVVAVSAAMVAVVTTQLLKNVILTRPELGVDGYVPNSFPSGHTTVAAASALVVFLVASPHTRWLAGTIGAAFAVAAGVSTLVSLWHRPSDVIAALLVVAFWGCVAGAVLTRSGGRQRTARTPTPARVGLKLQTGIAVLAGIVTAVAAGIGATGAFGISDAPVAYLGAVTAIVAVGFVLAITATRLFDRLP
ncbi:MULTISPECIES: phosphatase PAP2 family protein [unclassified Cryobacterium]|uniref:phosphatase PAP2 family protein n=1 Tax=unclassified Cryobacterium TaxID=2649013 RepID=UPI0010690B64|nr:MULTISPECIES: phosphatase PAP2 family protein [unclassified Cryobacterium]TFC50276.1 phosphatase PAP2 family protein [Cryobacterium sp. TMB3-1-2]TFC71990.1 phosphatase PAP2 family protein [Cryobacterium sp. TMB3-15]TFC78583.1 phosphatase PAP2 family protein [Cryobacterium sp. TMB3-10]TFC86826.1 phosphatase PAP2 family protein [Cryobacterium sp. TMT4-31]TFD39270.1 phosphatase PAP2 family protein [Cryobacterium sp. TMB3-12]